MKGRWLLSLCTLVALLVAAGIAYGKTAPAETYKAGMTVGNEISPSRPSPLSPPPAEERDTLALDVDYGGQGSCPLNYPNAKHITQAESTDAPFVVWEVGASNNNNVVFTYWDGAAWLTPAEAISMNTPAGDAGRIAICSDQHGRIHAVWHGNPVSNANFYEIWYARCDPPDYFWTTPVPACDTASADSMEDVFPSLTVDKDGNPWAAWMLRKKGISTEAAVVVNHSTDGGDTWTLATIDTLETVLPDAYQGIVGGWTLVSITSDWNTGDLHVAWPDTTGHSGYSGINYCMYTATSQTWGPVEHVAHDLNFVHPMALPSMAVDSQSKVHLVYQMNLMEGAGETGFLSSSYYTGPIGWLYYTSKPAGGTWAEPQFLHGPLVEDTIYAGCFGYIGFPSVAIDDRDFLYVVYTRADSMNLFGDTVWLPFDVYMSYYDGANWIHKDPTGEWLNVSMIDSARTEADWAAIFPQIAQRAAGPASTTKEPGLSITWAEMATYAQPSQIFYKRVLPPTVGIGGGDPGNPGYRSPLVRLSQNSPNPFAALTEIQYSVPGSGRVAVVIYNAVGQEVKRLFDGSQSPGAHTVSWDGRDHAGRRVANGLYFCQLTAGRDSAVRRMTVLR
jgi:hypothetical protein